MVNHFAKVREALDKAAESIRHEADLLARDKALLCLMDLRNLYLGGAHPTIESVTSVINKHFGCGMKPNQIQRIIDQIDKREERREEAAKP